MTTVEDFEKAVMDVQKLPKAPSAEGLLELYGLYKQAKVGDVQGKRPGAFDFKGRAKHDAWASRKGMSTEEARAAYVRLVERLAG